VTSNDCIQESLVTIRHYTYIRIQESPVTIRHYTYIRIQESPVTIRTYVYKSHQSPYVTIRHYVQVYKEKYCLQGEASLVHSNVYNMYTHTHTHTVLHGTWPRRHLYIVTYTICTGLQENLCDFSRRSRSRNTGWRRPIGCLKLQVIFRKRATNYRALLRKMTYEAKASYASPPPCASPL